MTSPIIDWLRLKWAVRDNQREVSPFFVLFSFLPSSINIPTEASRICLLPLRNANMFNYRINDVALTVCGCKGNQKWLSGRVLVCRQTFAEHCHRRLNEHGSDMPNPDTSQVSFVCIRNWNKCFELFELFWNSPVASPEINIYETLVS